MIRRDPLPQTVRITFASVMFVLVLSACSTSPVTGKRELFIVSPTQELSIGEREYLPNQQFQGGIYRTDPALGAYVRQMGQRLAAVADSALPYEFVVINNSTPNAWALPGGKIAINRGLLLPVSYTHLTLPTNREV